MTAVTVSAGIIVKCNGKYILGHVTGTERFDIFKGRAEAGESYYETAIRECEEESSLIFNADDDMKCLGYNFYTPKKDIFLYVAKRNNINVNDLKCTILMENKAPEMDYYEAFTFDEMVSKVGKSMKYLLKGFKEDIESY